MPSKEDVAKETGRLATTLTDDMQSAGLRKARELGFDLSRGRLSLEETLVNLSQIRDVLMDAARKNKLIHLPLKVQYTIYTQTLKVSETLTALVNGTDAVQSLEDVVDDLMTSAWQYNLHNLSSEVLGFQQKINQLKEQEVQFRRTSQTAQEFENAARRANELLREMESLLTAAKERGETINSNLANTSTILTQSAESQQKIAGLLLQAQQNDTACAKHEANAKNAAATAQAIAESLPGIKTDIDTAKTTWNDLTSKTTDALATFDQTTQSSIAKFETQYNKLKDETETATKTLQASITTQLTDLSAKADKLVEDTTAQFQDFKQQHNSRLDTDRAANNTAARTTIEKLESDYRGALKEQERKYEEQRTKQQDEHSRLVAELDSLENQIKDSIRRATGYTLFHSFQKRQDDLVKSKEFWAKTLAAVVTIAVLLSAGFMWYAGTLTAFGPAFYIKLSGSLPLIYAIWFCSVQYSRERRLEEEYAFKSSISISLDPYRELVEKLVVKDKPEELAKYTAFIIESVSRVFTSPTETAFDRTKDPTPVEGTIKATGDLVKDIFKLTKRY